MELIDNLRLSFRYWIYYTFKSTKKITPWYFRFAGQINNLGRL